MQTRYMMLLLVLSLGGCKIELDIFGKGKVETASGSFNCTNDGTTQSGDCTQTYNVDEEDVACSGTDCTVLGLNDTVEETWVATPEEGNNFNGFTGHCEGGGSCTHSINYGAAETAEKVTIEAHFEPEPPPQEVTYTHNYLGQMASMTVNGVTTFYVYDEQGRRLSEINEDGISIKDYIYAEDQLVAWIEKSGDTEDAETEEQVFYPLTNHLGQTFMTIRADGKLGHEQYTDPFGKVQAMYIDKSLGIDNTGPLPLTDGLPGQYLQPSAYLDNGHRTYQDGRYLQPDPIGLNGGMNPYLYANANPVMWFDFNGLDPGQIFSSRGAAAADLGDYSMRMHGMGYSDGVYEVGQCEYTYDWIGSANNEPPSWTYEPIHPGPDPVPSDPTPQPPAPPPPGNPESGPNWQLYIDIATIACPQCRIIKAAALGSDAWSVVNGDIEGPALSWSTTGFSKAAGASEAVATRAGAGVGAAYDANE